MKDINPDMTYSQVVNCYESYIERMRKAGKKPV